MTVLPIQTTTKVSYKGVTHEVRYPLVGEKFKIENAKLLLTNNQYGELSRSAHKTALSYLDTVDAYAYFSILIPSLKLSIDGFEEMNAIDEIEIRKAYLEQFLPFLQNTDKILKGEDKNDKDK